MTSIQSNSPEILGEKYEIQRLLASKGGRKTLLARDTNSEELVAIKLLTFGNDITWEELKLFEREAETLKSINHSFIPKYIDYFEIQEDNYKGFALVQAYIDAPSLEEQIQAGRGFTESEVKELATAILEILIYLHSRSIPIIHRDIKPSNILIGERSGNKTGDIYLVDFGSVQNLATKKSSTITVVGTYGYMPPEQFGGRAKPASDLFSLGATLVYLVTGQHPADLPENNLKIEFEQLVNLSPGLTNWLNKMIEPSLSQRFVSAEEALTQLQECHLYNQQHFQQKSRFQESINKPANSKVTLYKSKKVIAVKIPPAGLRSEVTYTNILSLGLISLFLPIIPWFFLNLPSAALRQTQDVSYFVWVLSLLVNIFFAVIIGITSLRLFKFIFGVLGTCYLKINSQKIVMIYELFGIKRQVPMPSPRKEIYRLEKIDKTSRNKQNYYLKLWAKKYSYQLGKSAYFPLTELEVDWLAQELSNWLDLPIWENQENSDREST